MSVDCCFKIWYLLAWGEKKFKSRPQNSILIPILGAHFKISDEHTPGRKSDTVLLGVAHLIE